MPYIPNSNRLPPVSSLASLGSGRPPAQPGEQVSIGRLRDLGALPLPEPLAVDQESDDGQQETVSHVEDADNLNDDTDGEERREEIETHLGDDYPDNTEPPELHGSEESSDNVTNSAGENVAQNVLYGVT